MPMTRVAEEMWRDYHNRMDPDAFKQSFTDHLKYSLGRDHTTVDRLDLYKALAFSVRDRLIDRMMATAAHYRHHKVKRVYYLSVEYLIGRSLDNNLVNLDYHDAADEALRSLNLSLEELETFERDAGLGNGGLGRLAACFMASLATHGYPAIGYGMRYDFGFFRQRIRDGAQVELPDTWLKYGNPWEFARPRRRYKVHFYGKVEERIGETGCFEPTWHPGQTVVGQAHDMLMVGYKTNTVNLLRLWSAEGSEAFDLQIFNTGDFNAAVHQKVESEAISKVLYPADTHMRGKELRLRQQYFFVSCSLQDILNRFLREHNHHWHLLPDKVAIQLNDTHPALAIPELMRLLLDEHHLGWETAWELTRRVFSYTNHTLLPEALERWPLDLMRRMLPRHIQIINEINRRFLDEVRARYPGNDDLARRLSIHEEHGHNGGGPQVRMAHLAVIGSHKVNGVSELHTQLLRDYVMKDFVEFYPGKFVAVTNGVDPRRWIAVANPQLAGLFTRRLESSDWLRELERLRTLEPLAEDAEFRREVREIKRANKAQLAAVVKEQTGVAFEPDSIVDTQVKRIHEYKRQLLNILHVIHRYQRLLVEPSLEVVPQTFLFGGKAAPGYRMAKLIIELINAVAQKVNHDPRIGEKLKVAFIPNYGVTLAERIIPGTDISEQISTAGYEASGTGNMKFAMNGALTLGTLDGATVEMAEQIGEEQMYIFGLHAEEVRERRPSYDPYAVYYADEELRHVIDAVDGGVFSPQDPGHFRPLVNSLLSAGDKYMVLADFRAYVEAQQRINEDYRDKEAWTRKAVLNMVRMASFSSDRTIHDYAKRVWQIEPQQVHMPGEGQGATQILSAVPEAARNK